jgi:hypothetical protein
VESPRYPLYLLGQATGDKSNQETLNLTLKVVDNLLRKPVIHSFALSYPQLSFTRSPELNAPSNPGGFRGVSTLFSLPKLNQKTI